MKTDLTPEQMIAQINWKDRAERLIAEAAGDGVIITIGLIPNLPLAMGNYTQVVDVRPRRVLATPQFCLMVPVVRDEAGYWTNPGYPPDLGENGDYKAWFASQGLEIARRALEDEDDRHPAYDAYFKHAHGGCEKWTPTPPAGEGWHTLSIHDTEDGPHWFWARRTP